MKSAKKLNLSVSLQNLKRKLIGIDTQVGKQINYDIDAQKKITAKIKTELQKLNQIKKSAFSKIKQLEKEIKQSKDAGRSSKLKKAQIQLKNIEAKQKTLQTQLAQTEQLNQMLKNEKTKHGEFKYALNTFFKPSKKAIKKVSKITKNTSVSNKEAKKSEEDYYKLVKNYLTSQGNNYNLPTSLLEGKNLVLYFYPKNFTSGCTLEAQAFRDKYNEFSQLDTVILGVSQDPLDSHQKFKNEYQLPFELISDASGTLCGNLNVLKDKEREGKIVKGIERSTFLFDKSGKLRKVWKNVNVKEHVNEVLKEVNKL